MKALAKLERAPGLTLTRVKKPEVGHNDVMIRIRRTAICGTDIHIWKWDDWAQKTIPVPMIIGHEFVGEVVKVGSNVKDFFPGDVVSAQLIMGLPMVVLYFMSVGLSFFVARKKAQSEALVLSDEDEGDRT